MSETPPPPNVNGHTNSGGEGNLNPHHSLDSPHTFSPDRRPKKSSSTCTTCRARKVRCDGNRDVCSNCQRLGFPCSYDDADSSAWSVALPRRRVKQACLSCHSRKARCSGHLPSCERCRAQGIECVYRPTKRARVSKNGSGGRNSPQSHDGDEMHDSDPGWSEQLPMAQHSYHRHQELSFDSLVGRTFDKFFRHVHHIPMFSFLHRASLVEQYHAGKVDKALLLALIGITSCLTDMGPGMREYGDRCVDDAQALIFADYTRPSTIKVQALVFMIKHRILSNKFPSAFILLSIASRFAAALRLNHESPNLCFLAQESRRRLIWSLYCIDSGISGGYSDFSLWRAESIHVGLPCNERNFEFDLPQPTENLVPDLSEPQPSHNEDVGSLALHIRIQYIRHKISEFTKSALVSRNVKPADLQTRVLTLHKELDDFATHLPASFQFSESSLRLRAYSPRICVFVMIHVWWRQCHCDLYRIGLVGLREALPRATLDKFDNSFLEHCQRQCVDHAIAMANIFSSMQKLNAKPVADLDLAICAYQCARILTYAHHVSPGKYDLTPESIQEQGNVCMQTIKECCTGSAAAGIRIDLEKLITQGLSPRTTPSRGSSPPNKTNGRGRANRNSGVTAMDITNDNVARPSIDASQVGFGNAPDAPMTHQSLPPSIVADPWVAEAPPSPEMIQTAPAAPANRGRGEMAAMPQQNDFVTSELNNAYEGALEGLGLDNGLDYAMGIDPWVPNGDWMNPEFMSGSVGV